MNCLALRSLGWAKGAAMATPRETAVQEVSRMAVLISIVSCNSVGDKGWIRRLKAGMFSGGESLGKDFAGKRDALSGGGQESFAFCLVVDITMLTATRRNYSPLFYTVGCTATQYIPHYPC